MKKLRYFSPDITECLFLLAKYKVRYLIVGGEAVVYYGYARLTGDIDLFYERTERNVKALYNALNEFWDGVIPDMQSDDELKREGMVFQFGVPPNRIDLVNTVDGVDFTAAWKNRMVETLSLGRKRFLICYVGLDELIRNKKSVGRDKDRDDLRFLTKAKKSKRR